MIGRLTGRARASAAVAACLVAASAAAEPRIPTVVVPGRAFAPGETLVVEIPTDLETAPTLRWGARTAPFYKSREKRWRALMRVPLDAAEGEHELAAVLALQDSSDRADIAFNVAVTAADFGFETITFSDEKAALLNDPSEDEESAEIRRRLAAADGDPRQHWSGPFAPPVPGPEISPYGITRKKSGQKSLDFHRGVDVAAKAGDPVRAPAAGRVLMAETLTFHGGTVLLSHGQGVGSIFIHMSELAVKEGDRIEAGTVLGSVGQTGLATAPHLHWGIYVHGEAVNPASWLALSY